jgi:hypothetical protein
VQGNEWVNEVARHSLLYDIVTYGWVPLLFMGFVGIEVGGGGKFIVFFVLGAIWYLTVMSYESELLAWGRGM